MRILPFKSHEEPRQGTLNKKLRTARERRFWSMEKAAEKVGVSLNTYSRWETGRQRPRLYSLGRLCMAFGMEPVELGFDPLDGQMDGAWASDQRELSVCMHCVTVHLVHKQESENDLEREQGYAMVSRVIKGQAVPCCWDELSTQERRSLSQALLPLWNVMIGE